MCRGFTAGAFSIQENSAPSLTHFADGKCWTLCGICADEVTDGNLPGQPLQSQAAQSLPWDPGSPAQQSDNDEPSFNPSTNRAAALLRQDAGRERRLPQQAGALGDHRQDTLLASHASRAPAVQVPNARQGQPVGSAARPAQSNLLQKSREPSTLRAPQGSAQKSTSMSKQLKVSSGVPIILHLYNLVPFEGQLGPID